MAAKLSCVSASNLRLQRMQLNRYPFLLLEKNLSKIKGKLRIQIACGTADKGHIKTIREFHAALLEHGVDHTYLEIENLAHKRSQMIAQYSDIWFDYHVESIRRATNDSN